jgi:hypothetical protein
MESNGTKWNQMEPNGIKCNRMESHVNEMELMEKTW